MEDIIKRCPFCGEEWVMKVTEDQYDRYDKYRRGDGGYIQDIFSDINAVEREFLKTGMCPKCQELTFLNGKTNNIKPLWEDIEE